MKRSILLLGLILLGITSIWSKIKPLSPTLYVKGVVIRTYEDVIEGDSATLLYATRWKGDGEYKALLQVNDGLKMLPLDDWYKYFRPVLKNKQDFWNLEQLRMAEYYDKKGYMDELRREQKLEAVRYLEELEKSKLFYDDAALEDYLQCALIDILPENILMDRKEESAIVVRILNTAAPDIMMLGNNSLLISTGLLALLDTEDELYALLAREVSHYLLDHALITVKKNIARANRAAFWGSVMDGVAEVAERTLYERNEYYEPGIFFAANDLIQALINIDIVRRMGLDYSKKQEVEADEVALRWMEYSERNTSALASALHKMNDYYQREKDTEALSKYGVYGTLPERVAGMPMTETLPKDRDFLKRMRSVVSFEAMMQDYNKEYRNSRRMAMKNIDNQLACADDYMLVARSIMKQSNTPESNEECLLYLDKADLVAEVEDINVTKMRILLMLRDDKYTEAVDLLKRYQRLLDILYQQPHSETDNEWIACEYSWAEKLLERLYII